MPTPALTDAAIRRFKPDPKGARFVRDGGARSLYLIVAASGSKSFGMRFRRPGGKVGKIVLGPYCMSGHELMGDPVIGQPLSLSAARQLAAKVHRERAIGGDVIGAYKARRSLRSAGADDAFAVLVRRYVAEHARPNTRRWQRRAAVLGLL